MSDFFDSLTVHDEHANYDRAPCGLLAMSPDGLILQVNQTFLDWTGHSRHDLVGRMKFAQLLTAGGRIYHETHYGPSLQMAGRAREIAFDFRCADGRRLPALVNSVLDRDGDGQPSVIRAAVFDATERRQYERELVAAKRRAETSEAHARVLAQTLQQTLIPPDVPIVDGLEVAAAYRPAGTGEEIGGDFYDVFQIGAGDWVVTIGDVQGKGVAAAVLTALVRYTIRSAAVVHPGPGAVLQTLNDVLLRYDTERSCTALVIRLRLVDGGWRATVGAGGHPLPMITKDGREPMECGQGGSLLGFFDSPVFHDVDVDLNGGDTLVVYTDGVSEARRGETFYGEDRIATSLRLNATSAAQVCDSLLTEVLEFQGDLPRDDIAIVAIRVPDR